MCRMGQRGLLFATVEIAVRKTAEIRRRGWSRAGHTLNILGLLPQDNPPVWLLISTPYRSYSCLLHPGDTRLSSLYSARAWKSKELLLETVPLRHVGLVLGKSEGSAAW